MNADVKKGLGRGLASLLGDETADYAQLDKARAGGKTVPIGSIMPGKFQPRHDFEPAALQQLADSIAAKGVLQPLLVRRDPKNPNQYELIAGERRWRAAQLAKVHDVPVLIRDMSDREVMEVALIENIQRQDLNPIEEAQGYYRLTEEFGRTQDDVAAQLGKSRSYISNMMRLLDLPKTVRDYVRSGELSTGHAKLLIGRKDAETAAREIVEKQLNVRQAESFLGLGKTKSASGIVNVQGRASFTPANDTNAAANPSKTNINNDGADASTRDLEKQLSQILGMRVEIRFSGKSGQLTVHYQNLDQLDDVLKRLKR